MILFEEAPLTSVRTDAACTFSRYEEANLASQRYELTMQWLYRLRVLPMFAIPVRRDDGYVVVIVVDGKQEAVLRQVAAPDDNPHTFTIRG